MPKPKKRFNLSTPPSAADKPIMKRQSQLDRQAAKRARAIKDGIEKEAAKQGANKSSPV